MENSSSQLRSIIDCGSNIGVSLLYFKSLYPDARIQTFEASPSTFRLLGRNVTENHLAGITLNNAAVCVSDCALKFYSEPGSVFGSLNPGRGAGECAEVRGVPLSRFITEPVDLLKIDIEGAETEVLHEPDESGSLAHVRSHSLSITTIFPDAATASRSSFRSSSGMGSTFNCLQLLRKTKERRFRILPCTDTVKRYPRLKN